MPRRPVVAPDYHFQVIATPGNSGRSRCPGAPERLPTGPHGAGESILPNGGVLKKSEHLQVSVANTYVRIRGQHAAQRFPLLPRVASLLGVPQGVVRSARENVNSSRTPNRGEPGGELKYSGIEGLL